ncbi:V-set and immunoglobulin domain-containing protein 10-like 2 [Phyllopteryx taeniolatus]|uniref:V-set and immunoglobulin domain-containing protein 10-like 2 n=1 Tax=Phyllopteryx taeniolatus TaxID=161469 RepID=UPI002AD5321E|nr:V-set and immunoglobulin domain-containing protein 10-like 2 [Phyllopteryx taeniolatus]XP_061638398.1 V-set and immunoglobulin domain-containing protein 10-like 2 [Phyllopteryx taeniolatus]
MFRMFPLVFLPTSWILLLPLRALDLFDAEEVEYLSFNVSATTGGSVRLDCGADPPSVFIWGFTRAGSDSSVALAYDYGRGPKLQALPGGAGRIRVPANTSALVVDEVRREVEGTYTCQALYHAGRADRVTFYYTRLDVEDD